MKTLWLIVLLALAAAAQVIGRNQLEVRFQLQLEQGRPFLVSEFANRTDRALPFSIPAGVLFFGEREPCNPVLLGRDIDLNIPPQSRQTVRVEALSLNPFPHTAGSYEMPEPNPDSRLMCQAVQAVWGRHRSSQLRGNPLRISQLLVYLMNDVEEQSLRSLFNPSELDEARQIQRGFRRRLGRSLRFQA